MVIVRVVFSVGVVFLFWQVLIIAEANYSHTSSPLFKVSFYQYCEFEFVTI